MKVFFLQDNFIERDFYHKDVFLSKPFNVSYRYLYTIHIVYLKPNIYIPALSKLLEGAEISSVRYTYLIGIVCEIYFRCNS